MNHKAIARLLYPSVPLKNCIFLAFERDTRGCVLNDEARFNYFPASPFPTVSWIFEGDLRMVLDPGDMSGQPKLAPPLPPLVFAGPYRKPAASWSSAAVHALTISFYPDALKRLFGIDIKHHMDSIQSLGCVAPPAVADALHQVLVDDDRSAFERAEAVLMALWCDANEAPQGWQDMRGWISTLSTRIALSGAGPGLRQLQRRFKDWTGQSHRELMLYSRVELALAMTTVRGSNLLPDLAATAADAGFADQSHMGRDVRRVTGISPGRLIELMRSEESFWLYRLLERHLGQDADAA